MLRALYDWTLRLSGHPRAVWALAAVSFIESSVFPIPPDVLLIPMVLAARRRAWWIAFVCTVASVVGGALGYAIGYGAFEAVGRPLFEFYGYTAKFDEFRSLYNEWGAWAVFIAGVTPFPYKVITILSGLTGLDFVIFMVSSLLARGLRFFVVAGLLWYFGDPIRAFIEKHLNILAVAFVVLLVGGFVVLRYAF
ncbi:MAG: DedA family protein [Rhodospirillales bacterium]|nr:DedA family protein [Rhodospirillales bacterium]